MRKNFSINDISKLLEKNLKKIQYMQNLKIDDVSSLKNIKNNSIIFLEKDRKFEPTSFNENLIISIDDELCNEYQNCIIVYDLNSAYNSIINHIFTHEDQIDFFDEFIKVNNSYISKFAYIHPSSKIFNNCTIGRGVEIGKNCIIKNNVIIKNSILGNDVIIGDNTTIGTTGFGFSLENLGAKFINPQIGIVYIDDNVRIGSNCTIDRAKLDYTYIGKNSMLDNLIHIAHNVYIGNNACIAAQSGFAGSVEVGSNLISGGQSGYSGHIAVGDNVIVAAKSGVTKNIKSNSRVAGFPAIDIKEWKKRLIKERKNGHK